MNHVEPGRKAMILNLVAFQACWWICILSAARGHAWIGAVAVAVSVGIHLWFDSRRGAAIRLYLLAGVAGLVLETMMALAGFYRFNGFLVAASLAPPWLVAMWVNLATTLHLSLRWMEKQLVLAAVLGLLSAPPTYYAGMRMGALEFGPSMWGTLVAVGVLYAVAFPAMVWANARMRR